MTPYEWSLPPSWEWASLAELADIKGGVTVNKRRRTDDPVSFPYLRVANVQNGYLDLREVREIEVSRGMATQYLLRSGDILLNEGGDRDKLGRGWVWGGQIDPCLHQNHVFRARPVLPELSSKFISYYANAFGQPFFMQKGKQSVNLASISLTAISGLPIPLAPLNEQRRIVDKIESLFAELDKGEQALREVRKLLARYRQSVLKAAVTGRLTADWRAQNAHRLEHGRDLLARILQTRRETWEGRGEYKEPVAPDTTDLPTLPDGWVWASAEQLCGFITKGTTPPKGMDADGAKVIPFLRVTNLTDKGCLDFRDKVFVSEAVHLGFLARSAVYPGDVLMNIVGPPLGQVSVVPAEFPEWNVNQAIAIFRAVGRVNSAYISVYLLSMVAQGWLQRRAKTTAGQTNLTLDVCRRLPIPLPPMLEQEEIVREFALVTERVTAQDAAVQQGARQSAALRQSILKDAFAGRLVPQDPSDEPAAELLARIEAARADDAASRQAGRREAKA